ncbi:MAG: NAD(+) synthase [Pseudomonadales bacterium]|nr:NAD(+) synthase [Pseudomonadales bacterium]
MSAEKHGFVRVASFSTDVQIAQPAANAVAILKLAAELQSQGVSVAVAPELCLSGYSAEDLFFSETLLTDTRAGLATLAAQNPLPLLVVGAPWQLRDGRLLNCAVAIGDGRVLGMVPKSVHPNYGEFYDLRWFTPGAQINETIIDSELGQFQCRCDQLFRFGECSVGIEVCEDLWAPVPPSTNAALAGANLILNPSASNELIAKADYRRDLVRMASARNLCAYAYASAGPTESTKDVVFGGHCLIAENGHLLAESERFNLDGQTVIAEIDLHTLQHDRRQNSSFSNADRAHHYRMTTIANPITPVSFQLDRPVAKHPFVPTDEHEFAARAQEILSIQATGLARRVRAAGAERLVIGLSGGLDSTLAYLVCLDTLAKLAVPNTQLCAITMPGPGTTEKTFANAQRLTAAVGAEITEISIDAAVSQHLKDLKHGGEHDVVFENAQARERTQILFNYANKVNGIVVGTGDLSELALGWCTYNADHMASYNVNASVPKTMMAYLVRWYAEHRANADLAKVLGDVLDTPISPELIPPTEGEISQKTEDIVGPYELHDFFLYHYLRHGAAPEKIFYLAEIAFEGEYTSEVIKRWLGQFFQRFFTQQFKRTTLPPGPKVGSVSLSPRGDWRMPDEASAEQILVRVDKL